MEIARLALSFVIAKRCFRTDISKGNNVFQ